MYRKIIGILLSVCLLFGAVGSWMTTTAYAADTATLTVSGGSVEVGSTITVSVKVSAPADIGIAAFTLTYDTSLLQCEGYSGTITEADYSITGKSKTYEYKFKALKEGTASIKASKVQILRLTPVDGKDDFDETKVTDGSVTVKAPYVASTNAYLKSLSISEGTIEPSFSKEKYEYNVSISGKNSSVTVNAKAEDSKAKVSVSGNKGLKEGKNTVSITVTAEDGKTKKTYKIIVDRGVAPTNTPTPTPTPTNTPTPSATPTPGLTVRMGDEELTLSDVITADLPDSYTVETEDWDGFKVAVASAENEEIKFVQMSDGKLYVYEKDETGAAKYYAYQTVGSNALQYRYLPKPETTEVPDGFNESQEEVDGDTLTVYRTEADETMCLMYLRSPEGNEGWYLYDTKEKTVQRYSDALYSAKPTETPTPTPTVEPDEPTPTGSAEEPTIPVTPGEQPGGDNTNPAPVNRSGASGAGFWKLIESLSQRERIGAGIIAGLVLLCILLLVLLILGKNRHAKEYDAEEPLDEDEEDEMDKTFDPRLLNGEDEHEANVAKAMKAMKDADKAGRKAEKELKKAKKSLDRVKAGKPIEDLADDIDEDDYDNF